MRHFRNIAAVGALFVWSATASGCQGGSPITQEQAEKGLGLPDTSSDGKMIRLGQRCALDQLIENPEKGSPEWPLFEVLSAASAQGDDTVNFSRFYAQFPPSKEKRMVREQYWPRAKQHVSKYLHRDPSEGLAFKICERREEPTTGEIRFTIHSQAQDKSNPPITVQKDEHGDWKIVFYSY